LGHQSLSLSKTLLTLLALLALLTLTLTTLHFHLQQGPSPPQVSVSSSFPAIFVLLCQVLCLSSPCLALFVPSVMCLLLAVLFFTMRVCHANEERKSPALLTKEKGQMEN
jgi:hypothetical protein